MRTLVTLATVAALTALLSVAAAQLLPLVRVAENWSQDVRVATSTPSEPQSQEIAVVTITEDTLASFPYRSPVDRAFVDETIRALADKGARLVALDLLFDQPSEPAKDAALRETLETFPIPLVVAWADGADGLTPRQADFLARFVEGLPAGVPTVVSDVADGTVRAVALYRGGNGARRPGFVAAVAEALGVAVPEQPTLRIGYRGRPADGTPPFASYPAHAVALLPDAWVAGKAVLVGADLGLDDRHRTPFSVVSGPGEGDMPGLLIQAHALSQLVEGRGEPHAPAWVSVALALVLAAAGCAVAMLDAHMALRGGAVAAVGGAAWAGGFALFPVTGMLVPLVAPTIALGLSAALAVAWRWREDRAEKQFIRNAFSRFVAPSVVDRLIAEPSRLALGGERREATFLFTDIAGYATLTETTEPSLMVKVMNEYMDGACDIVFRHAGTIDKMVGDALHVLFNAPVDQPDHAERAVTCALELDAYCRDFARRQRSAGVAFGDTRIGVNTGQTVVGNFGGERYFSYSATGDAINVAARLEGVNKHLGTRVCVSGTTARECRDVAFRPVGELVLKGKSEAIEAFEPVTDGVRATEEYAEAFALMHACDARAKSAFRALAERCPEDGLVAFHLRRLEAGETGSRVIMREK